MNYTNRAYASYCSVRGPRVICNKHSEAHPDIPMAPGALLHLRTFFFASQHPYLIVY